MDIMEMLSRGSSRGQSERPVGDDGTGMLGQSGSRPASTSSSTPSGGLIDFGRLGGAVTSEIGSAIGSALGNERLGRAIGNIGAVFTQEGIRAFSSGTSFGSGFGR